LPANKDDNEAAPKEILTFGFAALTKVSMTYVGFELWVKSIPIPQWVTTHCKHCSEFKVMSFN